MKRKKQIMEEKTFQRILQELSPVSDKIKVIGVGFFGESLVDPSVVERIKAIKGQFKNARIEITTNAALLTPELLDNLWEAGLDRIKVSINATKKSSYEKIMGINYEKTMRNLEYLSDFRKTHKLFTIGSFVSFTENKDELATFHKKFNGYFGNLVSCEADTWRENVSVVSERKKSTVKQPYPCKMLWTSAIFSANGDMISCCRDYDGEVTFGNINKALFSEIWFGEKRRAFLQNHLNSKLCSTCENKYSNYFYWWSR
jgi:radical SAM protein with 4Fe4S-binding SPASM domain